MNKTLIVILSSISIVLILSLTYYYVNHIYGDNLLIQNNEAQNSIGVNIHFVNPNIEEVNKIEKTGFKVVRMDLAWDYIERRKNLYDFSQYDKLVKSMSKRHIKIMFILDYGNPLYDKGLAPYSDKGIKAFARFATQAVHRYKGNKIIWEIWNEPNAGSWKPKPDAYAYSKLAIDTSKVIRKEDRNAFIVAPALAGFDYPYLNTLGKNGLFQYINAISIHPYRLSNPETVISDYTVLRKLIDRYPHNKNIQIFSGEWGYSTTWNSMNDIEQAQYSIREYLINIMSGVNLSIWYDWKDDGTDKNNAENNFGCVYNNLEPKMAYYAINTLTSVLKNYKFVNRMDNGQSSDYILTFRKGNRKIYVLWTTGKSHKINIQLTCNKIKVVDIKGNAYSHKVIDNMYNIDISNSVIYITED